MLSFFFKGFRGVVEHAHNPGEKNHMKQKIMGRDAFGERLNDVSHMWYESRVVWVCVQPPGSGWVTILLPRSKKTSQ